MHQYPSGEARRGCVTLENSTGFAGEKCRCRKNRGSASRGMKKQKGDRWQSGSVRGRPDARPWESTQSACGHGDKLAKPMTRLAVVAVVASGTRISFDLIPVSARRKGSQASSVQRQGRGGSGSGLRGLRGSRWACRRGDGMMQMTDHGHAANERDPGPGGDLAAAAGEPRSWPARLLHGYIALHQAFDGVMRRR